MRSLLDPDTVRALKCLPTPRITGFIGHLVIKYGASEGVMQVDLTEKHYGYRSIIRTRTALSVI